jgi:periplasmic protein TonB
MNDQARSIGFGHAPACGAQGLQRDVADLDWIVARMRGSDAAADQTGNVIPLITARQHEAQGSAPEIKLTRDDRPTPSGLRQESYRRLALLFVGSLFAHAGLYAAFSRQPTPTAGIEEVAITVEIMVGANSAAGTADVPSNAEAERQASTDARQQDSTHTSEVTRPEPDTTAARDVLTPQEPDPTVKPTPQDIAAVTPTEEPIAPVRPEIPPPVQRVEEPPTPKPEDRPRPMPKPSVASAPANNVGRGRMAGEANYQGLVATRLARYKRFPPEARGRREQGAAVVSFSIDADGRVTSVRLARKTGFAALDDEVEAMVRRASPFPPPPGGVPVSFSAPVSFHLN